MFHELIADDRGQDIVEYALLTALIGIFSIATWNALSDLLFAAYSGADADVQDLWVPPDPGGS